MHSINEKLVEPLLSKLYGRRQQHPERSEENDRCKRKIRHYHSAPEIDNTSPKEKPNGFKFNFERNDSQSLLLKPVLVFISYLGVGLSIFFLMEEQLEGERTLSFIDALYFCIVTLTTVGYGDLTPDGNTAKLFTCAFVFVGFSLVGLLLGSAANFLFDKQERMLIKALSGNENNVDLSQDQTQFWKVTVAGVVVLFLFTIGVIVLITVEEMSFIEAFYCVCVTVTTLGYGDKSFNTAIGRSFAAVWILVSTISVAQFFLYIAELRTESRRHSLVHWVLTRKTTPSDLQAADIDNDGVVSAAEFVLYKLHEIGTIQEEEVAQILKEFDRLDVDNSGKLSLRDLHSAQTTED